MGLRAGLIGCGGLGRVHTECLSRLRGMKMPAFCDIAIERAEALAREFGGEYATTQAGRLLSDESLSAIYVCTQHDSHADLCVRAAEAGKHVMVEKPLALTVEDCLRVRDAVRRTDVKLMTAFKMRYYEMLLQAKQLIPEPIAVTMQMMDNHWPDAAWQRAQPGVPRLRHPPFRGRQLPHLGLRRRGQLLPNDRCDRQPLRVFRFKNGVAGNWVQGDCSCPPLVSKFFMQIFAEGKSATLSDRLYTLTYAEPWKPPQVFKGEEMGFLEENRAFIEAIENDTPPPIDHVDGLYATLMVLQAFASLRSGRPEPIAAVAEGVE